MTTKEVYKILESPFFLKDYKLVQPKNAKDVETRRRIVDFMHEMNIAAFMLAMSFKEPYVDLFEEKDYNNKFKHLYYKQHYLYSAVIWYHNCFDLILQCLWFYHALYDDKQLKTDTVLTEMRACNIGKIVDKLYHGIYQNPISRFKKENDYILDLANKLKHRQFIENDSYYLYAEAFVLNEEDYNSDDTMTHISLNELQLKLIDYHHNIIRLSKDLLLPIREAIIQRLDVYDE